jgi:hypothetical protein
MKKSILILIFLFAMVISFSQNYNPFLKNIGWCTEDREGMGSIMSAYTSQGDTTIGSLIYTKLFKLNTLFLVREDTGKRKAWAILPNNQTETLLYDFGIAPGAQINLVYFGTNPVPYTVTSIDSISTTLGLRKRIKLVTSDPTFSTNLYWIEGIGSSYSPLYLNEPTSAPGMFSVGHCLICAYTATGVQSYEGTCGIPCIGYLGSPCYSFITGINETKNYNQEITINNVSDDLVRIRSVNDKITKYQIFSMEGRLLQSVQNLNKHEFLISTNKWMKGLYIVEITMENNIRITRKICK